MAKGHQQAHQLPPLGGVRVLIVEDEYYIADHLRKTLRSAGAAIVGPVGSLKQAIEAIDAGAFDCAVLDLNLHGDSAVPIAGRLCGSGKKFAISTGYGRSAVPERLSHVPRIEKPFDPSAPLALMQQLGCAEVAGPSG
jgi:DNA-binding NtrC family response regulator